MKYSCFIIAFAAGQLSSFTFAFPGYIYSLDDETRNLARRDYNQQNNQQKYERGLSLEDEYFNDYDLHSRLDRRWWPAIFGGKPKSTDPPNSIPLQGLGGSTTDPGPDGEDEYVKVPYPEKTQSPEDKREEDIRKVEKDTAGFNEDDKKAHLNKDPRGRRPSLPSGFSPAETRPRPAKEAPKSEPERRLSLPSSRQLKKMAEAKAAAEAAAKAEAKAKAAAEAEADRDKEKPEPQPKLTDGDKQKPDITEHKVATDGDKQKSDIPQKNQRPPPTRVKSNPDLREKALEGQPQQQTKELAPVSKPRVRSGSASGLLEREPFLAIGEWDIVDILEEEMAKSLQTRHGRDSLPGRIAANIVEFMVKLCPWWDGLSPTQKKEVVLLAWARSIAIAGGFAGVSAGFSTGYYTVFSQIFAIIAEIIAYTHAGHAGLAAKEADRKARKQKMRQHDTFTELSREEYVANERVAKAIFVDLEVATGLEPSVIAELLKEAMLSYLQSFTCSEFIKGFPLVGHGNSSVTSDDKKAVQKEQYHQSANNVYQNREKQHTLGVPPLHSGGRRRSESTSSNNPLLTALAVRSIQSLDDFYLRDRSLYPLTIAHSHYNEDEDDLDWGF